jgi:uncharacterized alkaline shock family protein YloU
MRPRHDSTDTGNIRVHDNAVASIAVLAATEIDGVGMVTKSLKSTLLHLLCRKCSWAVRVHKDEAGEITVYVPIVVKYGYNVAEVATRAQENIRVALDKMVNLSVKEVIINVQGIERGSP